MGASFSGISSSSEQAIVCQLGWKVCRGRREMDCSDGRIEDEDELPSSTPGVETRFPGRVSRLGPSKFLPARLYVSG